MRNMGTIGDDVKITAGVKILTHGYDWSVLSNVYDEMLGSSGKVTIGDNVFIGVNTTILKGVKVGDNVIIGANSLVNKDLAPNGVYAGYPILYITSVENYYNKRKTEYAEEAKELAISYVERFGKKPPMSLFHEFVPLFLERTDENKPLNDQYLAGRPNVKEKFYQTQPQFSGFESFF